MPVSRSKKLPSVVASLVASVGLFCCGYGAGYPSPVLPMLQDPASSIQLNQDQEMWFGALNSLGYLVAIPFGLTFLEVLGRKRAMLLNIALSAGSWALVGFAPNQMTLLCGRLLQGIASGLTYQTVPTYVSEIASASVRGPLISLMGFIYLIGRICVLSICYTMEWRGMAFFAGALSLVNFVAMLFMPESPRWLLKRNRNNAGKEALKWLRGDNNRLQRELRLVTEETQKANNQRPWHQTVRDPCFFKPMVIIVFIQTMVALSCDGPMYNYTESILAQSGFPMARLGVVIIAVIQFVTCIITNLNVDKAGRKVLLAISAVGTAVSLFCFGVHVYLSNNGVYPAAPAAPGTSNMTGGGTISDDSLNHHEPSALTWPYDMIPFALLCVYFIFHAVGALNVNHLMCSELTSAEFTGMAAGCSVFVCYGETFYSTLSFLNLQHSLGESGIYFTYSLAQMACIAVFMLVVPETGGDCKNIQLIWKGEIGLPLCNWRALVVEGGERAPLLSYSESVVPQHLQSQGSYEPQQPTAAAITAQSHARLPSQGQGNFY